MNELAGLHPQVSELDEYEQYLLSALLKKAASDAGRLTAKHRPETVAAPPCHAKCATAVLRKKAIFTGNLPVHGVEDDAERQINSRGLPV